MADLTPQQRQLLDSWTAEGATLNQIQDRLRRECGVSLTYMEARLLMMDLGVKVQDKPREAPKAPEPEPAPAPVAAASDDLDENAPSAPAPGTAELKIIVDDVPIQGAMISGEATFTDGETVVWYMDQMGRFGMRGPFQGYQPPASDIPKFQRELDQMLQLRGF